MTELRINTGTDASPRWEAIDLPSEFSTTLNYENVVYTKASEYTYDLEVPIATSATNTRIFGPMHRRDVDKADKTFRCILMVDNRVVIDNGSAVVTSVGSTSLQLQLMGGNSDVNFRSKNDKLYIDKIDLGNAMQDVKAFQRKYGLTVSAAEDLDTFRSFVVWASTQPMATRQDPASLESDETNLLADMFMRTVNDFPFVMLPSKDTETNGIVNRYGVKVSENYYAFHNYPQPYFDQMGITGTDEAKYFTKFENVVYAPQPYLIVILEKVIKYLGYSVNTNTLWQSPFKHIYICNTTNTIKYAQMLPHWTINEFFTQVENFFNCVINFREDGKCDVIHKADYFRMTSANYIKLPLDTSFETDTQSEELEEINDSSIEFTIDNDLLHKFDETINEHSKVVENSNPSQYFDSLEDPEKYSVIVKDTAGRHWICLQSRDTDQEPDRVIEADQLRKLDRGEDAETIELKICPAKISVEQMLFYQPSPLKYSGYYLCPMPTAAGMPLETKLINITRYIRGTENFEEGNTGDLIEIAMFDGISNVATFNSSAVGPGSIRSQATKNIPLFCGWTYGSENLYAIYNGSDSAYLADIPATDHLALIRTALVGQHYTIGSVFHSDTDLDNKFVDIDSKRQIEIQFADDHTRFDLRKPFIIAGKKYVCLRISADVTARGFAKIKTGTFFPLDI